MTTTLILVRHGQTAWNASGRFMGQTDVPLDEKGLKQAAAAACRLQKIRPQAIYASDLQRAWQTARIIHSAILQALSPDSVITGEGEPISTFPFDARFPERLPLIPEPRLREMSFGDWQGLTYPEIQEKYPRLLQDWEADRLHTPPPSGETLLQLTWRVVSAVEDITSQHSDQTIMLVAHGGSLEVLIAHYLGLPLERTWQISLANASISELQLYPAGAILSAFNDVCHLEGV